MATRRLTHDEDASFTIEGSANDISELEGDLDLQLSAITSEFDADENDVSYMLKVYRVKAGTGKMEYLFTCVPSELPILDKLRDDYGAGDYTARVYKNKKLHRSLTYSVGAPRPLASHFAATKQSGEETTAILKLMAEMQQKNDERFDRLMMHKPESRPLDVTGILTAAAPILGLLKEFIPRPQNVNPVEMLVQGITLASTLRGDESGSEKNMYDVLGKTIDNFGPVFASVLSQEKEKQQRQPVPVQAAFQPQMLPPNSIPQTLPNQAPQQPSGAENMNMVSDLQLKFVSKLIEQKANEGADPLLYADVAYDNLDDALLERFITSDRWFDNLIALNPNLGEHKSWLESLREGVLHILRVEGQEGMMTDMAIEKIDDAQNSVDANPGRDSGNT